MRVKGTTLDGARLRAVDRVPHSLKIVGRMPPEALAKFLVELGNSRSRQKTVVRFELPEDEMRDSTVKAYNRLVEVLALEVVAGGLCVSCKGCLRAAAREALGCAGTRSLRDSWC